MGLLGGNVMHVEMSLDQMMLWRPLPELAAAPRSRRAAACTSPAPPPIPAAGCRARADAAPRAGRARRRDPAVVRRFACDAGDALGHRVPLIALAARARSLAQIVLPADARRSHATWSRPRVVALLGRGGRLTHAAVTAARRFAAGLLLRHRRARSAAPRSSAPRPASRSAATTTRPTGSDPRWPASRSSSRWPGRPASIRCGGGDRRSPARVAVRDRARPRSGRSAGICTSIRRWSHDGQWQLVLTAPALPGVDAHPADQLPGLVRGRAVMAVGRWTASTVAQRAGRPASRAVSRSRCSCGPGSARRWHTRCSSDSPELRFGALRA